MYLRIYVVSQTWDSEVWDTTYIHKCMNTYVHLFTHIRAYGTQYLHKHVRTSVYTRTYMHDCIRAYMHAYIQDECLHANVRECMQNSNEYTHQYPTNRTHKSVWINKSLVTPKSTSNQSSKPCTVLQYPSRTICVNTYKIVMNTHKIVMNTHMNTPHTNTHAYTYTLTNTHWQIRTDTDTLSPWTWCVHKYTRIYAWMHTHVEWFIHTWIYHTHVFTYTPSLCIWFLYKYTHIYTRTGGTHLIRTHIQMYWTLTMGASTWLSPERESAREI